MSANRDAVSKGQLAYLWRVVLWLVVGGTGAAFVVAFAARLFAETPAIVGGIGFAAMVAVVGGALLIHRAYVRCPQCQGWLVPVGMNGFAPRTCPRCSADLR